MSQDPSQTPGRRSTDVHTPGLSQYTKQGSKGVRGVEQDITPADCRTQKSCVTCEDTCSSDLCGCSGVISKRTWCETTGRNSGSQSVVTDLMSSCSGGVGEWLKKKESATGQVFEPLGSDTPLGFQSSSAELLGSLSAPVDGSPHCHSNRALPKSFRPHRKFHKKGLNSTIQGLNDGDCYVQEPWTPAQDTFFTHSDTSPDILRDEFFLGRQATHSNAQSQCWPFQGLERQSEQGIVCRSQHQIGFLEDDMHSSLRNDPHSRTDRRLSFDGPFSPVRSFLPRTNESVLQYQTGSKSSGFSSLEMDRTVCEELQTTFSDGEHGKGEESLPFTAQTVDTHGEKENESPAFHSIRHIKAFEKTARRALDHLELGQAGLIQTTTSLKSYPVTTQPISADDGTPCLGVSSARNSMQWFKRRKVDMPGGCAAIDKKGSLRGSEFQCFAFKR